MAPCCDSPRITDLSGREFTNRYCFNCKGHYAGRPGEERQYTRHEWEAYVSGEEQ